VKARTFEPDVATLVATMLRAAREEQPSDASLLRSLVALGAGGMAASATGSAAALTHGVVGATAGSSAASKALGALGALGLGKWVSAGLIAGGLTWTAAEAVRSPSAAPASVAPAVVRHKQPVQRGRPAPLRALPSPAPSATAVIPVPVGVVLPAEHTRRTVPERRHATTQSVPPSSTLGDEVALLDAARRELAAGRPDGALQRCDEYRTRFAGGALVEEATYVRMEALGQAGRREQAAAQAQALLRDFPKSAHRQRARALVEQKE
jgi:hypothetical protein